MQRGLQIQGAACDKQHGLTDESSEIKCIGPKLETQSLGHRVTGGFAWSDWGTR